MSIQCEVNAKIIARAPLNFFERYLTAWVALCSVFGMVLGQLFPGVFKIIGGMEVAKVNLPVGLLIWIMIIPMLLNVNFMKCPLPVSLFRLSQTRLPLFSISGSF